MGYRIKTIIVLFVALVGMASCSESDNKTDEYADWQARNDQFYGEIFSQALASESNGDGSMRVITSYTKGDDATPTASNSIVVKVLSQKESHDEWTATAAHPNFTDSVRVHYRGRLMPSEQHPEGLIFDTSYPGEYDVNTVIPRDFLVSGVVEGFSTALMHMHAGDRWRVYIPYNLAYGASATGSIPAYSTLVFDITLNAFARTGSSLPSFH